MPAATPAPTTPTTRLPAVPLAAGERVVLLRAGQVAAWLGVPAQTVAGWARDGTLPVHHDGRTRWRRFVAGQVADAAAALGRRVPPLPPALRPSAVAPPPQLPARPAVPLAPAAGRPGGRDGGRRRANHTPTATPEVGGFLTPQRFGGACDPDTAELFFGQDGERGHQARDRQAAAKAICAVCPILRECRTVARADPSLEGIWGGETTQERRDGAPSPAVPAGNPAGRLRVLGAFRHAHAHGLPAAAAQLNVGVATLRRVLDLYGLPLPADPPAAAATGPGQEADGG